MEYNPDKDPDFRVRTLDVALGDKPENVINQSKTFLSGKIDEYKVKFIKKPAYKRLDGALRKMSRGSELNKLTKEALGRK